jgi:2-methoxy-6-polyprenyl-1,4-benzoquinol methylase
MWRQLIPHLRRRRFHFSANGKTESTNGDCFKVKEDSGEKLTSFGFKTVSEETKAEKVQAVFSSVAKSYDIMNDVMSLGLHRLWKDYFVHKLAPPPGSKILDVAGGTGDIGVRIADYRDERHDEVGGDLVTEVTVLDANPDMLLEGSAKWDRTNMSWIHGDAQALPFPNACFDGYTIAFGIRNVANIEQTLSEALRVLVPGGRFLCMEFSHVTNPLLKSIYDTYSFELIPVLGELIANDRESYQYLVESIRQFPDQDNFASMIKTVGFHHVIYESILNGVVAIHSGYKPFVTP